VRETAVTKQSINPAILLAITLIIFGLLPALAFAQDDAAAAIASARQQLVNCYDSARQAESAGANISSLTSVLNNAGQLLSQSELAYSQGDSDAAQSLASQVGQRLGNFVSDASALRDAAVQQQSFDFWVNIVGSVAGTIAVIVAGFIVWRFLKKRYAAGEVETEAQTDEPSGD
jgi:hypothetical protein